MTSGLANLSVKQLQQAIKLRTKIDLYEAKLNQIVGSGPPATKKRKGMSAAAKAKIGAAQKLRWAKQKGEKVEKPAAKTRRKMSAAAKARISAAAKKRWAKAKAAGKNSL